MNIVIADDNRVALRMLNAVLVEAGHTVRTATNGQEALEALSDGDCRLVISDWEMPVLDGVELCHAIRTSALPSYVYFILLTGRSEQENKLSALSAGIDDFMAKPFDKLELILKLRIVERLLSLESREMVIFAFAKLAESRDPETGSHLERVQHYVKLLAEDLRGRSGYPEVDDSYVQTIFLTSPLHDIGKAAIPDHILLKPGKLTPDEFAIMKTHAVLGAKTIAAVMEKHPHAQFLQMAHEIALTHHERFDGTGYPNGLKAYDIPLSGRIMAIADVYDALTTQRVYKPAFSHPEAAQMIRQSGGTHFDPALVEAFSRLEARFVTVHDAFH